MLRDILLAPISWIYAIVVGIRHKLFDWRILSVREFDIPIVCVGNLTVGGTGKTPHTEYLVEYLSKNYNVAVLSRGYKRRTKGFVLAVPGMSYTKIGDEPKQIKLKFPHIPVAVCEKRTEGIDMLRKFHPEVNLIILDDAFQHRYVEAWVNILLIDHDRPVKKDHYLPWGTLRDGVKQMKRAQMVIVTKCPDNMKPIDYRVINKDLNLYPYQSLYFSKFTQGSLVPLFPEQQTCAPVPGQNILAIAGIANPVKFFSEMSGVYNVLDTMSYPDHYMYRIRDLSKIKEALSQLPKDTIVVMTEKDAVKFASRKKIPVSLQRVLYYSPIKVTFLQEGENGFNRQLDQYVSTNHKYRILHPE